MKPDKSSTTSPAKTKASKLEILEIPDDLLYAGGSTLGSLLGMLISKGTKHENTGAIWGGFAGSMLVYWLIKQNKVK